MRRLAATLLPTLTLLGATPQGLAQAQKAAPAGRIEGRVTDARGEPVPAAAVWVQQNGMPVVQGRTDASGTFVLARVTLGALEVCAGAPDHVTSLVRVTLDEDAPLRSVALTLAAATRLSGQVTEPNGAPIAGARIVAASTGASAPPESAAMAVTDKEGRYAMDTVPMGAIRLVATAAGHRSFDLNCMVIDPVVQDIVMAAGGRRSLCLRIRNATPEQLAVAWCSTAFTVGGKPLALPLRLRSGAPDTRGEWRLDDLPADVAFREQSVRLPGANVRMVGRATMVDQCFTAEFAVQPAANVVLQGLLVDGSGRPMAGHDLSCQPEGGAPLRFQTDQNGAFSLPSTMAQGEGYKIVSSDPGLALGRRGGNDPKSYVLMATAAVGVSTRVTDAQGRPVRGAEVVLRSTAARGRPDNQTLVTTASNAQGVIAINRLVPAANQTLVLEVRSPDGNATSAPFELPQSGVLQLPPLQLTPCGVICGTVRDGAGKPVPFAAVTANLVVTTAARATAQREPGRSMLTDRDGSYRFAGLLEGAYTVTFAPVPGANSITMSKVQLKGGAELVLDSKVER